MNQSLVQIKESIFRSMRMATVFIFFFITAYAPTTIMRKSANPRNSC